MSQSIQEEQLQGNIFLEPDEKYLCAAGTKQLQAYMKTNKLRKCFAVLSDRAVYCKGKCAVSRDHKNYQLKKTDFRLDLEEFQGMKYLPRRNHITLSLAFFFLLLGPALVLLDKLTNFSNGLYINPMLDGAICLLLAGVFFLLYSIHKKTFLELIHTNGSIGLDLRVLPAKEERLLLRYLRAYLNSLESGETTEE